MIPCGYCDSYPSDPSEACDCQRPPDVDPASLLEQDLLDNFTGKQCIACAENDIQGKGPCSFHVE